MTFITFQIDNIALSVQIEQPRSLKYAVKKAGTAVLVSCRRRLKLRGTHNKSVRPTKKSLLEKSQEEEKERLEEEKQKEDDVSLVRGVVVVVA